MTLAIFVVGMIGLREAYGVLSPARLVYGHVDKTEPTTIRAATIPASTMPMLGRCQFLYLRAYRAWAILHVPPPPRHLKGCITCIEWRDSAGNVVKLSVGIWLRYMRNEENSETARPG